MAKIKIKIKSTIFETATRAYLKRHNDNKNINVCSKRVMHTKSLDSMERDQQALSLTIH